jgi:ribonuclease BN (tRNA processing enzyme)
MSRRAMHFLGTGSATSLSLGAAAAVLVQDDKALLQIDCGSSAIAAYQQRFADLAHAIYITHVHLDHIAGLETLFYAQVLPAQRCRLYVPHTLVTSLHYRLAEFPGLAEGGANFWDRFHLIPVGAHFFHAGLKFASFPVRHHQPGSAFGLALPGSFVYSGDTRPIPEIFAHFGSGAETLFHDCSARANPSHTGAADILREYPAALRERLWLYHQHDAEEANEIAALGLRVLRPGQQVDLAG